MCSVHCVYCIPGFDLKLSFLWSHAMLNNKCKIFIQMELISNWNLFTQRPCTLSGQIEAIDLAINSFSCHWIAFIWISDSCHMHQFLLSLTQCPSLDFALGRTLDYCIKLNRPLAKHTDFTEYLLWTLSKSTWKKWINNFKMLSFLQMIRFISSDIFFFYSFWVWRASENVSFF